MCIRDRFCMTKATDVLFQTKCRPNHVTIKTNISSLQFCTQIAEVCTFLFTYALISTTWSCSRMRKCFKTYHTKRKFLMNVNKVVYIVYTNNISCLLYTSSPLDRLLDSDFILVKIQLLCLWTTANRQQLKFQKGCISNQLLNPCCRVVVSCAEALSHKNGQNMVGL